MIAFKTLSLLIFVTLFQQCLLQPFGRIENRKFLFTQQQEASLITAQQQNVQPIGASNNEQMVDQQQQTEYQQASPTAQQQDQTVQPLLNQQTTIINSPTEQQPEDQPIPPAQEKDIMLVIPFTKEQFEREMKVEGEKLKKESKFYYDLNIEQLKNITIENKKIIDEKKELIKLYMNHTTYYLDNLANVLQRELEQNHDIMLNLAQAIILSTLENYDHQISKIKLQIQDIILKVQPPLTICEKFMGCSGCVSHQDCIWSPDRRACFVGSKYDGCYFDYCEYFIKDHCISNAKSDIEEQNQLDHYTDDEDLAKVMKEIYNTEDVELAAQRIPQPQKNYFISMQNKLITLKDKIQRIRIYINYMKKIYFKLRYQNIIFKRNRQKQKEEDKKFLEDLEKNDQEYLKHIQENEEDKLITIDDLIKNDKVLSDKPQDKPDSKKKENQQLTIKEDGSIILQNGDKLEGLRVVNGQLIDEFTGEIRTDLKFVNGRIVGEDGKPLTTEDLQQKLADEENYLDNLLFSWFGDEYEPPNNKLAADEEAIIEKEKDHTVIDVDSDEVSSEEQSILEYVADQVEKQKQLENED